MKDSDAPAPALDRDRARALRAASTDAERKLWANLRGRQLKGAKFRRQHPIPPYIADFFCLEARLIVELDGSQHGEEAAQQADQRRTAHLEGQDYRVLRFWNDEVLDNLEGVLERIAEFL
ncbi:MAG TPA: endonuclease domain-containing protein [Candidatus Binataceae bacterium]|nr:endonuclease domain-containing protein [Candidatus Binataceae bacterium]